MATTPTPAPSGFEQYLPAIEQGINIALLALTSAGVIPGGPLALQLAAPLENALNSLIVSIKSKQVTASTYLAVLGAEIDTINALKAVPGVPADVLKKLEEYSIAVEGAITAYLSAQKGFDASNYAPVTPIITVNQPPLNPAVFGTPKA